MLVHELLDLGANRRPDAPALTYRQDTLSYAASAELVRAAARGYLALGVARADRVAIYLEKRLETAAAQFGAAASGAAFVPINPLLRARQVAYILKSCDVHVLVTTETRLDSLAEVLADCPELRTVVVVDPTRTDTPAPGVARISWPDFIDGGRASARPAHRVIDADMAAILFTSGSTGMPKGVVLSHGNLVASARSAATHIGNVAEDRLLCVLPFSFDYGIVQLTSAFHVGASVVLMNYLLPRDVPQAVVRERITGLAAVPPLWIPLADLDWPAGVSETLRYATNSGGAMPRATLDKLRRKLPRTGFHLMYGLTEAFRSTALPPPETERRPGSVGRPIPNAEVMVVRPDGTACRPGEPGEIVHRGAFVSKGYWRNKEATAERFRPVPKPDPSLPLTELAVWSGDLGVFDEDGFLTYIGRRDEQIKTSGFRVSPTEVEDIVYSTHLVGEAVAFGVAHEVLGQAIVVVATPPPGGALDRAKLIEKCREVMPTYMVPHLVVERATLPRTPNGKMDRPAIARDFAEAAKSAAQ